MSTDTTAPKTRTITLTDRPPVKIHEDQWPVIAMGSAYDDDSSQPGNSPNREWTRQIRVRRHEDGRVIVYGVYEYETALQGEDGAAAKRGMILPATAPHDPADPSRSASDEAIISAIRAVGADLAEAESDAAINASHKDSRQWRVAVQACIADLPAEEL